MRLLKVAMPMALIIAMVVGCATNVNSRMTVQSHRDEIDSLLKKLLHVNTKVGDMDVLAEPSIETRQDVHDALLRIANQAPNQGPR